MDRWVEVKKYLFSFRSFYQCLINLAWHSGTNGIVPRYVDLSFLLQGDSVQFMTTSQAWPWPLLQHRWAGWRSLHQCPPLLITRKCLYSPVQLHQPRKRMTMSSMMWNPPPQCCHLVNKSIHYISDHLLIRWYFCLTGRNAYNTSMLCRQAVVCLNVLTSTWLLKMRPQKWRLMMTCCISFLPGYHIRPSLGVPRSAQLAQCCPG